jgi:hypothetical protein
MTLFINCMYIVLILRVTIIIKLDAATEADTKYK